MAKSRAANPIRQTPPVAASLATMQRAWTLYSGSQWQEAEKLGAAHLQRHPRDFGALTLLGIIAAQTRRTEHAEALLGRAATIGAQDPSAHNNYGNVLRDLRRYPEALASYERALALKPDFAEAHYNRGVVLQTQARYEAALASYERALALRPEHAATYNNRGVVLRELGRSEQALDSYDHALAIDPQHAAACNNRGVTLQQLGRLQEALASYAQALALNPNDADALKNQGRAFCWLAEPAEARSSYERAVQLNPQDGDAHSGLGVALQLAHELDAALASFERAVALDPRHADAHYYLGNLLRSRGQLGPAVASYERALAIRPDHAETLNGYGETLHELGRLPEAILNYARALQLNPKISGLQGIYLAARMQCCDWEGIEGDLSALRVKLNAGQPVATPFSVLTLIDSPRLQQCAAESWVARNCPPRWTLPPLTRRERAERLRIGYYSADFYHHATTVLAEDLFKRHDRRRFEIVGLRFGRHRADEVTQRLATDFDRFIDVHEQSDIDVARLSRELGIDIAVDLKGMTEQHRLGIFAHRAAPVQVNYLGFPGTSGASYMDYIIADRMLIPERYRDCYGEKVVYLPDSYQINGRGRAIAATVPTREQMGLPAQGFVFCCFNNVYKITPAVFDVWMSVLRRVAGSVLWLMEGGADAATHLRAAAEARGVGGERLIFAERLPTAQHLARHRLADLFLDTLPCNAHTTASDALWAGLPLVTCAGESFASRVASSLLHTVGLPELIARNLTHYESLIVRLANEPARLAALRERLERNRLQGPLFDLDRYVQGLESAYQMMYERHQSGQPPEHILAG